MTLCAQKEIAHQPGMGDESPARKAFNRAIKRFPPADVKLLRKLHSERLIDSGRRLYSDGVAEAQLRAPFDCNIVAVVSTLPSSIARGSTHRPCVWARGQSASEGSKVEDGKLTNTRHQSANYILIITPSTGGHRVRNLGDFNGHDESGANSYIRRP